jgi:hypothetical protein
MQIKARVDDRIPIMEFLLIDRAEGSATTAGLDAGLLEDVGKTHTDRSWAAATPESVER